MVTFVVNHAEFTWWHKLHDAVFMFISVGRDGTDGRDGIPGINGIPGRQGLPGK